MPLRETQMNASQVLSLAAIALVTCPAVGTDIVPTWQGRLIEGWANAYSPEREAHGYDILEALDYGLFDESLIVAAATTDGLADSASGGTQISQIMLHELSGQLSSAAAASSAHEGASADATGHARYHVEFELTEPTDFALFGLVDEYNPVGTGHNEALVSLTGPNGNLALFEGFGQFDFAGHFEPGTYSLLIETSSFASLTGPGGVSVYGATSEFSLTIPAPGTGLGLILGLGILRRTRGLPA